MKISSAAKLRLCLINSYLAATVNINLSVISQYNR